MNQPPVEVANTVRACGAGSVEKSRRWLHWSHLKVLNAVARCRTAALGGHLGQCPKCGRQALSQNSCLMGSSLLWGVEPSRGRAGAVPMPFELPKTEPRIIQ
jgi:hypothetical protein